MGKRKTLLVDEIMAFRDWLRKQQERSERNRQLFEGRPMVRAEQVWGGYQDRPGGQRLMTRQMTPPPASVTVTEKNDGTRTKVTKWEPDKASRLKVGGISDEGVISPGQPIPPPRNQRNPFRMPLASLTPSDAIRTRQRINRFAPVVMQQGGLDIRGGSARVPSFQEEGLYRDPVSSGLPTGGAPRSSSHPSIMSMGMDEFYSWLRRQKQGIADRQERNRINRLMQHPGLFRSRTPYYPTGGRY